MIGVVIPAHNEARYIRRCLTAIQQAASSPYLHGEPVKIIVVLDDCSDATGAVAQSLGVDTLAVTARNVGIARAVGAQQCVNAGARWLAFTDADTVVADDWLVEQLRHRSDAVCGTIAIRHWRGRSPALKRDFETSYNDAENHRHIHGANLGVSAEAYLRAGGFPPLTSSEDVALVKALQAGGSRIAWTATPRVMTSARKSFRAPLGFGATLLVVESQLAGNLSGGAAAQPLGVPAC